MSYSVRDYAGIIGDAPRVSAYKAALAKHITEESVVLDLGAGPGIFSLLSCQLGAKQVYAIEPNSAIQLGKELARDNGFEERITFYEADSLKVELPEQVDIIVSDIRGQLPLIGKSLEIISDARERFLKPDGVIIPDQDILFAELVSSESLYEDAVTPYDSDDYGLLLRAIGWNLANTPFRSQSKAEELISRGVEWQTIDYKEPLKSDLNGTFSFSLSEEKIAHGFYTWFDTVLTEGVEYTSGPGAEVSSYQNLFFPFLEPLELLSGDEVTIQFDAKLVGDEHIWCWATTIERGEERIASFEQSSFFGELVRKELLSK